MHAPGKYPPLFFENAARKGLVPSSTRGFVLLNLGSGAVYALGMVHGHSLANKRQSVTFQSNRHVEQLKSEVHGLCSALVLVQLARPSSAFHVGSTVCGVESLSFGFRKAHHTVLTYSLHMHYSQSGKQSCVHLPSAVLCLQGASNYRSTGRLAWSHQDSA